MAFLPEIAARTDAVVNITTGGSAIMTLDDRLAGARAAEPEMCSLNMGSMNFALYPMAARITEWKHDWEKPFLENSDDLVFKNTPRDIAQVLSRDGRDAAARGSSSSATISAISTCCGTSSTAGWRSRRCSCSSSSASSAARRRSPTT
jgi:uncharacterized protein (DUF849 family)